MLKSAPGALLLAGILGVGSAIAPSASVAQDFPNRLIRIVVPNAAGSGADLVARVMTPEMSKFLGQKVIVENRPGGGGIIGYEYVAKQTQPDGHALSLVTVQSLASIVVGVKDLRFDPVRELVPIANFVEGRFILASPTVAPWKNLAELIAYAKANPGKLNYGSASWGVRLTTEALLGAAGIQVTHVPYKDGAIYGISLGSNEVQMGFVNENQVIEQGDRVKVIAVSGDRRLPPFMDAPTFKSLGYPQIPGIALSLNVRGGTPKPIMDKLHAAITASLKVPEVVSQMSRLKFEVVFQSQEAAMKDLVDTVKLFAEIAKKIGLEPQ